MLISYHYKNELSCVRWRVLSFTKCWGIQRANNATWSALKHARMRLQTFKRSRRFALNLIASLSDFFIIEIKLIVGEKQKMIHDMKITLNNLQQFCSGTFVRFWSILWTETYQENISKRLHREFLNYKLDVNFIPIFFCATQELRFYSLVSWSCGSIWNGILYYNYLSIKNVLEIIFQLR